MRLLIKLALITVLLFGAAAAQTFPDKYHTYAEGVAELQALEAAHPDFCSLDSVGYSNLDHLIVYAFKISDNVSVEEDEPAILFTGGVHADEILGVEIAMRFCNDIVTRYAAGDTGVTRYVNNYEIYVIPFANPEGHTVVEGGDMDWRKNKTDNNRNGILDYHDGVDNNRNYDFGWNIDTGADATTPESLMYKGPYAFSESENVCMAAWGQKYKPLVAVEYHSPTYGRSEKVYYNWYWYSSDGGHGMAPDENSMHNIGIGFAGSVINDRGDSTYEARRALVNKGDFKTYFYGNFGTAAFVCEVSDTTIQDTSLVDGICQRNLAGMYYLLRRSGYARLTGVVTDSITGAPLNAEVQVVEAISADINPRLTRANTGRYDRLIDPGTYTLRFVKSGYATKTITGVIVNNSGPTTTNARLRPLNPVPDTPVLVYPSNGASFADSTALNFDWNNANNATTYIIEIAHDVGFGSYFAFDSTLAVSAYRNAILLSPGTYFWRVTAHNSNGYSARSQVWQFTITQTPSFPSPELLSPGDGFTSTNAHLTFDWTEPSGADRYAIEIDTDTLFTPPLIRDTTLVVSQYLNIDSLANGDYFWHVKAHGLTGWSNYSERWSFTVAVDTGGGLVYLVGDVNHNGAVNGIDVIYFVNFLKGIGAAPPLEINGFYPEADVNGNCAVNGIDVGYLVNFFKGGSPLIDGDCLR
jgi:hypothetical protein